MHFFAIPGQDGESTVTFAIVSNLPLTQQKIEAVTIYLVIFHFITGRRVKCYGALDAATVQEFIQSQQLMNTCSALAALRSVVPCMQLGSQLIM